MEFPPLIRHAVRRHHGIFRGPVKFTTSKPEAPDQESPPQLASLITNCLSTSSLRRCVCRVRWLCPTASPSGLEMTYHDRTCAGHRHISPPPDYGGIFTSTGAEFRMHLAGAPVYRLHPSCGVPDLSSRVLRVGVSKSDGTVGVFRHCASRVMMRPKTTECSLSLKYPPFNYPFRRTMWRTDDVR